MIGKITVSVRHAGIGMFYVSCAVLTGGLAVLAAETTILLARAAMIPAWLT